MQKQIPKLITKAEARPPIEQTAAATAPQPKAQALTATLQLPKPAAEAKVIPFSYERQAQIPSSKYALTGLKPASKYTFKEPASAKTSTSGGLLLQQKQILKPIQKYKPTQLTRTITSALQIYKPMITTKAIEKEATKSIQKERTAAVTAPQPKAQTQTGQLFPTAEAQQLDLGGGGGHKYPFQFPKPSGG
jgi:hypothetical protein